MFSITYDITQIMCMVIACSTAYSIFNSYSSFLHEDIDKPKQPIIFTIHKDGMLDNFPKILNEIIDELQTRVLFKKNNETLTRLNKQILLRNTVNRVVLFTKEQVQVFYNEYSNSDFNCIQDRTNTILVNDIKSYNSRPVQFSIDVEISY